MKKIYKRLLRITLILLSLFILWKVYDLSSWERSPEASSLPVTTHIYDREYALSIDKASKYLKEIPGKLNVPSFSVAVGMNNKIIWSEAIGYARIEEMLAASPDTKYRVGSTSKAITATGVARLADKGKLDLDAYVGDSILNYPKKKWNFTTRQLMSHTAGLGNYGDFPVKSWKYTLCNCYHFPTVREALNIFNEAELLYEPGTDYAYSTFDIVLSSAVLEQASGESFLPYMEKEVFRPLKMTNTLGDHSKENIEHLAGFYETKGRSYREWRSMGLVANDINLSYKWAGGGFLSTPSDLVKMGNAYLNDTVFISPKMRKEFWTPQRLRNGEINEQQYALGWRSYEDYTYEHIFDGEKPVWMVHHGGVSKGSMNFLVLFPEYSLVINASMNARAESFGLFWTEVMKLAAIFLETENQ
ncbi:serine hydrolase [Leptobacterium flavescens]|uniref:Serine hydrolase n=1 Tax=Leptobacterium flavescens TaxID=472055 RepID=A0A6P0UKE0_9FLAO|nr:serine hydrolase [Leptobacterium flavescens]NER13694.1 serine hydrolase [Leptobacterium flavescens]